MTLRVVLADTPQLLAEHFRIRREVFIGEQGVTEAEEVDGRDDLPTTACVVGLLDHEGSPGTVVAAGRLLDLDHPSVHVGRVAVSSSVRGSGLGRELMRGLEHLAAQLTTGELTLVLDAQEYAQGFYASLGYARTARERFQDARIWHVEMAKRVR
ncbi:GNAT family N-acetyltransferase [Propionibacteriaceae bacterium G1746]|uniref:GNAT family N-acetyltransferase n=1 Tax=Aestuariimicrobium sp. G57 TaxID=3418485 RepID=UPI003C299B85